MANQMRSGQVARAAQPPLPPRSMLPPAPPSSSSQPPLPPPPVSPTAPPAHGGHPSEDGQSTCDVCRGRTNGARAHRCPGAVPRGWTSRTCQACNARVPHNPASRTGGRWDAHARHCRVAFADAWEGRPTWSRSSGRQISSQLAPTYDMTTGDTAEFLAVDPSPVDGGQSDMDIDSGNVNPHSAQNL